MRGAKSIGPTPGNVDLCGIGRKTIIAGLGCDASISLRHEYVLQHGEYSKPGIDL